MFKKKKKKKKKKNGGGLPITLTCNFGGIRRRALEDFEDKKRRKKKKKIFCNRNKTKTNKQLDLFDYGLPCQFVFFFRKEGGEKEKGGAGGVGGARRSPTHLSTHQDKVTLSRWVTCPWALTSQASFSGLHSLWPGLHSWPYPLG